MERIEIVDWDVKKGNGKKDILKDDKGVMLCQKKKLKIYKGSGEKKEKGVGNIVNEKIQKNKGSREFSEELNSSILKEMENLRKDLIIIQDGLDENFRENMEEINIDEQDLDWEKGKIMEREERL